MTRYCYLLLLIVFGIAGCKKEFDGTPLKYQFNWPFKSRCGGYLNVSLPNAFTPTDNGLQNHHWYVNTYPHYYHDSCQGEPVIIDDGIKSFYIEVRDLNNTLYYSSYNVHETWDGLKGNSHHRVSLGQYLWKFRIEDLDGVIHEEHGTVNVIY